MAHPFSGASLSDVSDFRVWLTDLVPLLGINSKVELEGLQAKIFIRAVFIKENVGQLKCAMSGEWTIRQP